MVNFNLNINYPVRSLKVKRRYRTVLKKHLTINLVYLLYNSFFFKNLFIFKLQRLCMRRGFKLKIFNLIFKALFYFKLELIKKPFLI